MKPEVADYIGQRESILDRVRHLVVDGLGVRTAPADIDPDTPLFGTGLGLDSIDAVELVVLVEEQFGLKWDDEAAARGSLRTVNAVVDLVLRHQGVVR